MSALNPENTRLVSLAWSRHPDLNWGPADYEAAGHRVIERGTAPCLEGVGRNLGSSCAVQRAIEIRLRKLPVRNPTGPKSWLSRRLALTVTLGHRILPSGRRRLEESECAVAETKR